MGKRKGWRRRMGKQAVPASPVNRPLVTLPIRFTAMPPARSCLERAHHPPFILCKIGSREYMRDLVENGTVYMQRWVIYKDYEDRVRGDPNEGLALRFDGKNPSLRTSVTVGSKKFSIGMRALDIHSNERDHATYCMCWIQVPGDGTLPSVALMPVARDPRIRKGFGDTMVVFRDTRQFVRRLLLAAQAEGYELDCAPIDYAPQDYCGEMGPFRKLERYRYQCEWRFMTTSPIPEKALILKLGSLLDIAGGST